MKTLIGKIAVLMIALLPAIAIAQTPMDKLFNKYAGEDGFTSVNISKEMFMLFADIGNVEDEEFKEFQDMVNKLDGMKILSYTPPANSKKIDFLSEIKKSFPLEDYSELMSVKEGNEEVNFYILKKGKDIKDLIMIADEADQVVLLNFSGIIDLKYIAKMSKAMKVKGLENLDKINDASEKDME